MNRAAIVNAGKSGKLGGKQMKLSRRGLISVVSALAATTIGFAAPARAADSKEIVYLTPSLDLPFWRYLSHGIESEAKKPAFPTRRSTRTIALRRSLRMHRTRSRVASPASPFRPPTARPRQAFSPPPRARRFQSSSRTSAPTAATTSRSSSPTTNRARSASARRWPRRWRRRAGPTAPLASSPSRKPVRTVRRAPLAFAKR